jgi:NADH-quinone oxidoreductase subunit A
VSDDVIDLFHDRGSALAYSWRWVHRAAVRSEFGHMTSIGLDPGDSLDFFLRRLCESLHKGVEPGKRFREGRCSMGTEFTPVFLFLIVAIAIAAGMIIGSAWLAPQKATKVKQMPYESGMDPIGDARQRFDVRYYLVAIVFLLFDVELLFLYPWAVAHWSTGPAPETTELPLAAAGIPAEFRGLVFGEILLFILILAAAFAYAWRKGVFEWR